MEYKCPIFVEHEYNYDPKQSDLTKSVFVCVCGSTKTEHEDGIA